MKSCLSPYPGHVCGWVCVLLREAGPFPRCATPYSTPGVEPEEFKLLKGRSSGSGVLFVFSVSVTLLLAQVVHPSAPCPLCLLAPLPLFFCFFGQLRVFFCDVLPRAHDCFLDVVYSRPDTILSYSNVYVLQIQVNQINPRSRVCPDASHQPSRLQLCRCNRPPYHWNYLSTIVHLGQFDSLPVSRATFVIPTPTFLASIAVVACIPPLPLLPLQVSC